MSRPRPDYDGPAIDRKRCRAEVVTGLGFYHTRQCNNKATHGKYCCVHDPEFVAEKRRKLDLAWEAEMHERRRGFLATAIGNSVITTLQDNGFRTSDWSKVSIRRALKLYMDIMVKAACESSKSKSGPGKGRSTRTGTRSVGKSPSTKSTMP